MEVVLLGHASILFVLRRHKILCDPHFSTSYSCGLFAMRPSRKVSSGSLKAVSAIFISHRHRDHYDLRTLSQFDRTIPVYCAHDQEITYGLGALGFSNIKTIHDWQKFRIGGMSVTVTPSRYHVPEHGLLVSARNNSVWHMVDTIVDSEAISRVHRDIGRIDLLVWPYQPLKEVDVIEGRDLAFPRGRFEAALETLSLVNPRFVVPYADGQFGRSISSWINRYRFPVSHQEAKACAKAASPRTCTITAIPGRVVKLDGTAIDVSKRAGWIKGTRRPTAHEYDLTAPVLSVGDPRIVRKFPMTVPLSQLLFALNERSRAFASEASTQSFRASLLRLGVHYDIELILDRTAITLRFGASSGKMTQIATPKSQINRCVVRMTSGVLQHLIDGRLHFIAAYLGGLFRTSDAIVPIRRGKIDRVEMLDSINSPFSTSHEYLLTPARWFNAILAQDSELWRRVIEYELASLHAGS